MRSHKLIANAQAGYVTTPWASFVLFPYNCPRSSFPSLCQANLFLLTFSPEMNVSDRNHAKGMPQAVNSLLSEKALNLMLSSFASNLQKASKQISQYSHHCLWYLEFMFFWWHSKYTCDFQEQASFNFEYFHCELILPFPLSGAGDQSQSPESSRQTPALNGISTS